MNIEEGDIILTKEDRVLMYLGEDYDKYSPSGVRSVIMEFENDITYTYFQKLDELNVKKVITKQELIKFVSM